MKICSPTYCCAGPGCAAQTLCSLIWDEIDWEGQEINRLTQKRKKRVIIPISQELFFALEAERDRRKPQPDERILVNPSTGDPMTRPRLYQRMLALGKRAGVPDAHPHRYWDSFAVDMLARGASPYDVAKLLGDTVATVEKHYAPFVKTTGPNAPNHGKRRRFGENSLHKFCTLVGAKGKGSVILKEIIAGEPVSRILKKDT
jgi:integrase